MSTVRATLIGAWLFRYRSWIPPLLFGVLVVALAASRAERSAPGLEAVPLTVGVALAVTGLALRAYAVGTAAPGTSGRNTRIQVADSLNTTGLYSVVRHPVYLGNLLAWLGLSVATGVWWAVLVTAVAFGGFYQKIIAVEERFLSDRFGGRYVAWARGTPGFVPDIRRWIKPESAFAPRIALRQEYYSWWTVTVFFAALDLTARSLHHGRFATTMGWMMTLGAMSIAAAVLRLLQRKTTLLDVPGR